MQYQEYLLLLRIKSLITKKEHEYEKEMILYNEQIKKNPNHKIVYYMERGISD